MHVFWLVLAMTLTVALAAFVVGIVALPARRAGRAVFTERGERLMRRNGGAPVPGATRAAAPSNEGRRSTR